VADEIFEFIIERVGRDNNMSEVWAGKANVAHPTRQGNLFLISSPLDDL
jgi:hypothetical protein